MNETLGILIAGGLFIVLILIDRWGVSERTMPAVVLSVMPIRAFYFASAGKTDFLTVLTGLSEWDSELATTPPYEVLPPGEIDPEIRGYRVELDVAGYRAELVVDQPVVEPEEHVYVRCRRGRIFGMHFGFHSLSKAEF